MTDKSIILEITPVPKPRMTQRDKWDKRPSVQKYWAFKEQVQVRIKEAKIDPELYNALDIRFYVPMPKSWSKKKKKAKCFTPHTIRPDVDNFCKSALDSLYKEDSKIYRISAVKYWAMEGSMEIEFSKW